MQLQPSPNKTKKPRTSELLMDQTGTLAKPGLGGSRVRQNPAVVADMYRSSARTVLEQLGFPRQIPR
jgi:hypothetical protein